MSGPDLLSLYHRMIEAELKAVREKRSIVSAQMFCDWLDELERVNERLDEEEAA